MGRDTQVVFRGTSYAATGEDRRVKPVTIMNVVCMARGKPGLGNKQKTGVRAVRNGLLYH